MNPFDICKTFTVHDMAYALGWKALGNVFVLCVKGGEDLQIYEIAVTKNNMILLLSEIFGRRFENDDANQSIFPP